MDEFEPKYEEMDTCIPIVGTKQQNEMMKKKKKMSFLAIWAFPGRRESPRSGLASPLQKLASPWRFDLGSQQTRKSRES